MIRTPIFVVVLCVVSWVPSCGLSSDPGPPDDELIRQAVVRFWEPIVGHAVSDMPGWTVSVEVDVVEVGLYDAESWPVVVNVGTGVHLIGDTPRQMKFEESVGTVGYGSEGELLYWPEAKE